MNSECLILFAILLFALVVSTFFKGNTSVEGFSGNQGPRNTNVLPQQHVQQLNNLNTNYGNNVNANYNANTNGSANNYYPMSNTQNRYDNYNHFSGQSDTSDLMNGETFYGPDGGEITVQTNSDGSQSLVVQNMNNQGTVLNFTTTDPTDASYNALDASLNNIDNEIDQVRSNFKNTVDASLNNVRTNMQNVTDASLNSVKTNMQGVFDASFSQLQSKLQQFDASMNTIQSELDASMNNAVNNKKEGYTNLGYYGSATKFYGPNGATATVVRTNNGNKAVKINTYAGTVIYTKNGSIQPYTFGNDFSSYENPPGYNPPGYAGGIGYNPPGPPAYGYGYNPDGYNPPGYNPPGYNPPGPVGGAGYNPPGYNPVGSSEGNALYYNPPGPVGGVGSNYNPPGPVGGTGSNYNPPGPVGGIGSDADKYILKSQIVPPVCPAGGGSCNVGGGAAKQVTEAMTSKAQSKKNCQPCPPCARCPEPNFDCKKVPNYSAMSNDILPSPVLNDFSTFGM